VKLFLPFGPLALIRLIQINFASRPPSPLRPDASRQRQLVAAHPATVRLRTVTSKTWGDMRTRVDVTVQWKKALGMRMQAILP
jgi:hypothetical protein